MLTSIQVRRMTVNYHTLVNNVWPDHPYAEKALSNINRLLILHTWGFSGSLSTNMTLLDTPDYAVATLMYTAGLGPPATF